MKTIYSEKLVEELIKHHPLDFLGEELHIAHQQKRLKNFIPDLIFKDKYDKYVIVEVQINALDRSHFYRVLEYRDLLVLEENCEIPRIILFCNALPSRFKQLLEIHNVKCIHISKENILEKAKIHHPKLQFVSKNFVIKDKPGLTVSKLLQILQKNREEPVKNINSNAVVFWMKTWQKDNNNINGINGKNCSLKYNYYPTFMIR